MQRHTQEAIIHVADGHACILILGLNLVAALAGAGSSCLLAAAFLHHGSLPFSACMGS